MHLVHEQSRLAALRQFDVLDTPPEDNFDRITAMTARLFDVDMACVTLVDKKRFFFKSVFGADITELDRQPGFCDTTIRQDSVYCIEDTTEERTVRNHPLVCNPPHIRFYAGSPLKTSDGFAIGTLCLLHPSVREFSDMDRALLREMSEFVMYQLECRKSNAENERMEEEIRNIQKLETLGVLTGGIAHDFNNLLVGVLGSATLADSQIAENSPAKESLMYIIRAANHGKTLTDQLLNYAGQQPLATGPVDLSKLIRDMSPLIGSSLAKNVTFEFDCAPDIPSVLGDPSQLRQVILNLITNASEAYEKYTGAVGVTLASKYLTESEIENAHFGNLEAGQHVLLEVIDRGCGMDENTSKSLFDPFYTTKQSGRGLGMSIVQRIVREHAGLVQVETEIDQGCTISILLPAAVREFDENVVQRRVISKKRTGTGTVLVVDDEELVAKVTSSAIRHLGFNVITASNGIEALKMLNGESDVVALVLDATLPGMSGAETFDEIKKLRPELPTVIISGHHIDNVAGQFPDFEELTFLQKPWTFDDLTDSLFEALAK